MTSVFTQNGPGRNAWFKKRKRDDNRNTLGRELEHLDLDHAVKTDSFENSKRRTLNLTRRDGQNWAFTLQSYGIHHRKKGVVEMLTYVDYVDFGGPAHVAGMQAGDIILSINGVSMEMCDHTSLIDYIRQQGNSMRLVVLFEDCVRKVELHLRLRKLKKLLAAKEFELKSLELREKRITNGFGSLSDSRWSLRSASSMANFSLPPDSRSLHAELDICPLPWQPHSPMSSPVLRKDRSLRKYQLERRDSRLSFDDVSECDVMESPLDTSFLGSLYGDNDELSSPNVVLNPRVDLRYTNLPANVSRKGKCQSHVGRSTFYSPAQDNSQEAMDTDSVFGSELSRDLSVYQTWTGTAPEVSRDSGIYNTWSGNRKKKRRGETRSIGNSLFYVDSEENLDTPIDQLFPDKKLRKRSLHLSEQSIIDQSGSNALSQEKPPGVSYEEMGARPKSKYSTSSDSQLSVRHKKDKDFGVKYRHKNGDREEFLKSNEQLTPNGSLVMPKTVRSRRPSSLPIIPAEEEVTFTPDVASAKLRDSGIESPVFFASPSSECVPASNETPAENTSDVKRDMINRSNEREIPLSGGVSGTNVESEHSEDKQRRDESPKHSPLLNVKKLFTRSPSLPSLYTKSKWSPFEFTRTKLRNSLSKLRRKSGSYSLNDQKLTLPKDDSRSTHSAIGQLIRSASTISLAQVTHKPEASGVEVYATLPKRSRFLSFGRRSKSAGNVLQKEETKLSVGEYLQKSDQGAESDRESDANRAKSDKSKCEIVESCVDDSGKTECVTRQDETPAHLRPCNDEHDTSENSTNMCKINHENDYVLEFQKLSEFDFHSPGEGEGGGIDTSFMCDRIDECSESLEYMDSLSDIPKHKPTSAMAQSVIPEEEDTADTDRSSTSEKKNLAVSPTRNHGDCLDPHEKGISIGIISNISDEQDDSVALATMICSSTEGVTIVTRTDAAVGKVADSTNHHDLAAVAVCGEILKNKANSTKSSAAVTMAAKDANAMETGSHGTMATCGKNSEIIPSIMPELDHFAENMSTEDTNFDKCADTTLNTGAEKPEANAVILNDKKSKRIVGSDRHSKQHSSANERVEMPNEISSLDVQKPPRNKLRLGEINSLETDSIRGVEVSAIRNYQNTSKVGSEKTLRDHKPIQEESKYGVRAHEGRKVECENSVLGQSSKLEVSVNKAAKADVRVGQRGNNETLRSKRNIKNSEIPVISPKETETLIVSAKENKSSRLRGRQISNTDSDQTKKNENRKPHLPSPKTDKNAAAYKSGVSCASIETTGNKTTKKNLKSASPETKSKVSHIPAKNRAVISRIAAKSSNFENSHTLNEGKESGLKHTERPLKYGLNTDKTASPENKSKTPKLQRNSKEQTLKTVNSVLSGNEKRSLDERVNSSPISSTQPTVRSTRLAMHTKTSSNSASVDVKSVKRDSVQTKIPESKGTSSAKAVPRQDIQEKLAGGKRQSVNAFKKRMNDAMFTGEKADCDKSMKLKYSNAHTKAEKNGDDMKGMQSTNGDPVKSGAATINQDKSRLDISSSELKTSGVETKADCEGSARIFPETGKHLVDVAVNAVPITATADRSRPVQDVADRLGRPKSVSENGEKGRIFRENSASSKPTLTLTSPAKLTATYGAKIRSRSKSPMALRSKLTDGRDAFAVSDAPQTVIGCTYKPRASSLTASEAENKLDNSMRTGETPPLTNKATMQGVIKHSVIQAAHIKRRSYSETSHQGDDSVSTQSRSRTATQSSDNSSQFSVQTGSCSGTASSDDSFQSSYDSSQRKIPSVSIFNMEIPSDSSRPSDKKDTVDSKSPDLDLSVKSAYDVEESKLHHRQNLSKLLAGQLPGNRNHYEKPSSKSNKTEVHKITQKFEEGSPLNTAFNHSSNDKPVSILESRITLSNVIQRCMDRDAVSNNHVPVARKFKPLVTAPDNRRRPIIASTSEKRNKERYLNYINKQTCETQL